MSASRMKVALNPMTSVPPRNARWETQTYGGASLVRGRRTWEGRGHKSREEAWSPQELEEAPEPQSPRAYSRSTAQPTSIVDFWPQNRRNMISVVSSCPVCCYRRPRSWRRSHTAVNAELTEVGVVPGRPGCTPGGELGRLPVGGHPGLAPA